MKTAIEIAMEKTEPFELDGVVISDLMYSVSPPASVISVKTKQGIIKITCGQWNTQRFPKSWSGVRVRLIWYCGEMKHTPDTWKVLSSQEELDRLTKK